MMPSLWGKSLGKDAKKKASKESFMDILHRKFKSPSEAKLNSRSGGSQRHCNDSISERGSLSQAVSRSSSPSKHVARCQSFADRPHAQPLPLPGLHPKSIGRTNSGIVVPTKPRPEKCTKSFLPLPRPACIRRKANKTEVDGGLITTSVSSESSSDSDDPADSGQRSPQATDCDTGVTTTACSPSRLLSFFDRRNP
ncbi:hypothetical protein SAY86_024028 [Trapa natans]|uniref:Uncharacterized protein n=1 Tax=Trapa natans TaxID=22666 RepID=A0AAN7RC26_TRANT|nr:hypothetical protein SAY86_024028 [Trapa natans]